MRRWMLGWAMMLAAGRIVVAAETRTAELKEIPQKWSATTSLVYEERGIFLGDTWLSVDGGGRAVVWRAKVGGADKEIPAGIYVATLSAEELGKLMGVLRGHEFKERREPLPQSDGEEVTAAVTVDGAVARSRFEEGGDKREAGLVEFRDAMRKVILRVVQESSKRPAEETLAKWLEGTEVVELRFSGPHEEPEKLAESLKVERSWAIRFMVTPGEGKDVSLVSVCMHVDPENVKRLQALREELEKRGFELEAKSLRVWSRKANAEVRKKAQATIEEGLKTAEKDLKAAGFQWKAGNPPRGSGVFVQVTDGAGGQGSLMINDITMEKAWDLSRGGGWRYEDEHLPRLGMMVVMMTVQGPGGKATAPNEAIRKAFREAIEPLVKLEAEAR